MNEQMPETTGALVEDFKRDAGADPLASDRRLA